MPVAMSFLHIAGTGVVLRTTNPAARHSLSPISSATMQQSC
jgi:hypothetical protein